MALTGYLSPLERTSFINFTAVSGYTTARMQVALPSGSISSLAEPYGTIVFQVQNTSDTAATVQIKQSVSPDYRSGRTNIGAAMALVANGFDTVTVCPTQQIVELWCTANGPANIRTQVVSRLDYSLLGFVKNGTPDPQYPPIFWQAQLPQIL